MTRPERARKEGSTGHKAEQPAPAPCLSHPEGCATLPIVLVTVPRESRSCEHFPDGLDLHLLRQTIFSDRHHYREKEFFIDNLLVRIYFIIVMIRWTGLAPWEFEFPFPGSRSPTTTAQQARNVHHHHYTKRRKRSQTKHLTNLHALALITQRHPEGCRE